MHTLKTVVVGIISPVIFTLAMRIGFQAEREAVAVLLQPNEQGQ